MAVDQKELKAPDASAAKLIEALADKELPLDKAIAASSEVALARAWAKGEIEFGRIKHCTTGRKGHPDTSVPEHMRSSVLLIEDGIEWSGPKTPNHVRFSELAKKFTLPDVDKYKRYVAEIHEGEPRWKVVDITRDQAVALMAPLVRLTDKGMGEII